MTNRILAFSMILIAAPVLADDYALFGPLRVHDMSPLALLRLDMVPPHAVYSVSPGWGFEFHYSQANLFMVSDAAKEFLEQRSSHGPLSETEANAMVDLPGDVFFFDAEAFMSEIIVTRAFTDQVQVALSIPYHHYGGGALDPLVESFHNAIGLNDAGRTLVPRRQIRIINNAGERQVIADVEGHSGFGDMTVTLRRGASLADKWCYTLEGAVRLPTGRDHLYFSSDTNYGVQAAVQRLSGRHGAYGSVSYVWAGRNNVTELETGNVPSITASYELGLTRRLNLLVQGIWSSVASDTDVISELTRDRTQVSVGVRHRTGPYVYSVALTENVINFKNTPDIGIHFGFGFIPTLRPPPGSR
jgi:hypothetical protein